MIGRKKATMRKSDLKSLSPMEMLELLMNQTGQKKRTEECCGNASGFYDYNPKAHPGVAFVKDVWYTCGLHDILDRKAAEAAEGRIQ